MEKFKLRTSDNIEYNSYRLMSNLSLLTQQSKLETEIKEAETNVELREALREEFIKTYWSNSGAKIEDDIAEAAKGLF